MHGMGSLCGLSVGHFVGHNKAGLGWPNSVQNLPPERDIGHVTVLKLSRPITGQQQPASSQPALGHMCTPKYMQKSYFGANLLVYMEWVHSVVCQGAISWVKTGQGWGGQILCNIFLQSVI